MQRAQGGTGMGKGNAGGSRARQSSSGSGERVESADNAQGHLRLRRVNREQVTPVPALLDALLPTEHLARLIWMVVERLDLSGFYKRIKVVEGGSGQSATDPKILVALWLYATTQGVTSGREINRLCVEHLAYLWLCGGVSMNYHTLDDFRTEHAEALDQLMTDVLGRLNHAELIEFEHTAQDGIRVRASAGAASFRRQPTLEKCLAQAKEFLASLTSTSKDESDGSGGSGGSGGNDDSDRPTARQQAARERAARERVARIEAALAEMPKARAAKDKRDQDQARVSTTDPEARVMKMPDGGYRPAYNFQFAADTAKRIIQGVEVTNVGSDKGQAPGMVGQVEARLHQLPKDWLMDGGFVSGASIERVEVQGPRVLAPVQTPKDPSRDPYQSLPTDSPALAAWRVRMGTEEAKVTYRLRASTIELVNAQARAWHGLSQLRVRGLAKARCVALWVAIAHSILVGLRCLLGLDSTPTSLAVAA